MLFCNAHINKKNRLTSNLIPKYRQLFDLYTYTCNLQLMQQDPENHQPLLLKIRTCKWLSMWCDLRITNHTNTTIIGNILPLTTLTYYTGKKKTHTFQRNFLTHSVYNQQLLSITKCFDVKFIRRNVPKIKKKMA